MIKLIPVEQGARLEALCKEYALDYKQSLHAYVSAFESLKAQCVFSLSGIHIELLAIDFDSDDTLIPEMLLRAIGSYAGNRSGYLFFVPENIAKKIEPTLITMHFEKTDNGYLGKVPIILKGSCCQNKE